MITELDQVRLSPAVGRTCRLDEGRGKIKVGLETTLGQLRECSVFRRWLRKPIDSGSMIRVHFETTSNLN
jgi:hypothetical protein